MLAIHQIVTTVLIGLHRTDKSEKIVKVLTHYKIAVYPTQNVGNIDIPHCLDKNFEKQ